MAALLLAPIGQRLSSGAPKKRGAVPMPHRAAPTPPMGWNSFISYGDSVTEDEVLANAGYMKEQMGRYGWKYIVVDYRWYDGGAKGHKPVERAGVKLSADWYGRLMPAVSRFPSAKDGAGFKPLADKLHGMGLKFGIHILRGIPRQAVKADRPIENSSYSAADAANTDSICSWCPDMYGVKAATRAGQDWYDSIIRQYAAWGVDFIKVDDLTNPYSGADITAIRRAIDKCGRSIVFSASPGPTSLTHAKQVQKQVDMWRISRDFWDNWKKLNTQFDLLARWKGRGGQGHWPDPDMLPIGTIGQRSKRKKQAWQSKLSKNEQVAMMSLWTIAPAPLMLGANLPDNDEWTLSLVTNKEVLDVNQDVGARQGQRVWKQAGLEVWVKPLANGDTAIALFNRSERAAPLTIPLQNCGLSGEYTVRDLWHHNNLDNTHDTISVSLAKHGAALLRLSPVSN